MIYEALVIDNSNFAEKGTIRVRIKDKTLSPLMVSDISEDPKKSVEFYGGQEWTRSDNKETLHYLDTDVKVSSPFGGGYDYGVFYLPQPNSWGLVAAIGDQWEDRNKQKFVWIGALYQKSIATKTINIPSDEISKRVSGVEGDGEKITKNIKNLNSALVIKTKTTKIAGGAENINQEESKKTLNWKKRPTENLIVVDKDEVEISHNILNDKEETKAVATLKIDSEGFEMNFYNKEDSQESKFKLDNFGNFEIVKNDKEIKEKIKGDKEGVTAEYINGNDKSAMLKLGGKPTGLPADYNTIATVSASDGKSTCSVNVKSTGIDIESTGDVNISPGRGRKVTVGGTGLPVLVSPTGGDLLVGNVTIPCSTSLLG